MRSNEAACPFGSRSAYLPPSSGAAEVIEPPHSTCPCWLSNRRNSTITQTDETSCVPSMDSSATPLYLGMLRLPHVRQSRPRGDRDGMAEARRTLSALCKRDAVLAPNPHPAGTWRAPDANVVRALTEQG